MDWANLFPLDSVSNQLLFKEPLTAVYEAFEQVKTNLLFDLFSLKVYKVFKLHCCLTDTTISKQMNTSTLINGCSIFIIFLIRNAVQCIYMECRYVIHVDMTL